MNNDLQGKRIAMLLTDGVEQIEYLDPREFLEKHGAQVELVSIKPAGEKIQGFNHLTPDQQFQVESNVREVRASDYDALVLPGGVANPDQLRMNPDAVNFVREFGEEGKPIAAICHGPWLLVESGIARGKRMTSWSSLQTDIRNAGGEWVDEPAVRDGQVLTSRGPQDLEQFDAGILELVSQSAMTGAAPHGQERRLPGEMH